MAASAGAGATIREKYKSTNSLICLLQGLVDRVTTVELRNESTARGCILNVDGFMNIKMSNVLFTGRDGTQTQMDIFFVQGPQIRYVQVPDDVDMMRVMKQQLRWSGTGLRKGRQRGKGAAAGVVQKDNASSSSSARLPQPD